MNVFYRGIIESEYNKKKLSAKLYIYDTSQNITITTLKALSHLHSLHNSHPVSSVQQSYRHTLPTTERILQPNISQRSPKSHITLQQPNIDN